MGGSTHTASSCTVCLEKELSKKKEKSTYQYVSACVSPGHLLLRTVHRTDHRQTLWHPLERQRRKRALLRWHAQPGLQINQQKLRLGKSPWQKVLQSPADSASILPTRAAPHQRALGRHSRAPPALKPFTGTGLAQAMLAGRGRQQISKIKTPSHQHPIRGFTQSCRENTILTEPIQASSVKVV